ncbi:unnamed protein product [Bursaphelenchus xylophilus]|uniref:Major sperm protein n=1 Tax=Bursaphelenchus xylophilus TaxID=6326 RepID=A0A1I7S0K9_BURXY|nr:unnamed protein product [Bursaphelenchus xylophilus]CAG9132318.1 unnamed protein product [Bursaphelenchus xylophilus]
MKAAASPMADSPRPASYVILSVDPEKATFLDTGGRSEHMLANLGDTRLAVKAKCSDNNLYRVNPVYIYIEPGQCHNLLISRLPGPPKNDKLVLHYIQVKEPASDIKEVFKNSSSTDTIKIPMLCLSHEDVPVIGNAVAEKK